MRSMHSVALICSCHQAVTYFLTVHFNPVCSSATFSSSSSGSISLDEEPLLDLEEDESEELVELTDTRCIFLIFIILRVL